MREITVEELESIGFKLCTLSKRLGYFKNNITYFPSCGYLPPLITIRGVVSLETLNNLIEIGINEDESLSGDVNLLSRPNGTRD